jgi:hypothetical protein
MQDIAELHDLLKRKIAVNGRREAIVTIPADQVRRARSLRTCHRPAEQKPLTHARVTNAYVPELSEALERDPNLCDGARRCGRLISAYTYRRDRETRTSELTISYLSRALGRCRRTVQRYLRQLERAGYIEADVIASSKSRMCVGLSVRLLHKLFPKHHARKWPSSARKSGATALSQKQKFRYKTVLIPVWIWEMRCTDPIRDAYMKTLPPLPALL